MQSLTGFVQVMTLGSKSKEWSGREGRVNSAGASSWASHCWGPSKELCRPCSELFSEKWSRECPKLLPNFAPGCYLLNTYHVSHRPRMVQHLGKGWSGRLKSNRESKRLSALRREPITAPHSLLLQQQLDEKAMKGVWHFFYSTFPTAEISHFLLLARIITSPLKTFPCLWL